MTDATQDAGGHAGVQNLTGLLDTLERAAKSDSVSIRQILEEMGDRSFTPLILAISVLLISPISGIPTVPTISAVIMVLIAAQKVLGRDHLWLPDVIARREVASKKFRNGIDWLRKPCGWVDRHSHERLSVLTHRPLRLVGFALCVLIPLCWPPLELLPMVTSVGALAIALIAFGMLTHDGLYVLLGYIVTGAAVGLAVFLILRL